MSNKSFENRPKCVENGLLKGLFRQLKFIAATNCLHQCFDHLKPRGVLAMFAYGGVRVMFLGLKFHLKAIFLGPKFANMNFPFFGGKNFQQLPFYLSSIM